MPRRPEETGAPDSGPTPARVSVGCNLNGGLVLGLAVSGVASLLIGATAATPSSQDACAPLVDSLRSVEEAAPAPPWVPDGMPPDIWRLVDTAYVADDEDTWTCLLDHAEREVDSLLALSPDDVDARFARAVVLGVRADRAGGRTKVQAANELHRQLATILRVEPDHARARHLMGRLHAGVMRLGTVVRWIATTLLGGGALDDASWEAAEQHLTFAEERAPRVLNHHLELARLYYETGRPELAMLEIAHVRNRPATSAMERAIQRDAAELLEEIGG